MVEPLTAVAAVKDTVACALPATALTPVGALGTAATAFDTGLIEAASTMALRPIVLKAIKFIAGPGVLIISMPLSLN